MTIGIGRGFGRAAGTLLALALMVPVLATGAQGAAATANCGDCHADIAKVLPARHPQSRGDLAACLGCHKPDATGKPAKNGFSVAMHGAHAQGKAALACTSCHVVKGSGKVGVSAGKVMLVADEESFEAATRMMTMDDAAAWTAGMHAAKSFGCASCHGPGVPKAGAEVANDRCLSCHGPMDALVQKTRPAQFADRNPHHSHLGDIACTTCHRGHEASAVYCLDCHPKFQMKISGAARR